jgi:ribosomal protein L11 methyltransferase
MINLFPAGFEECEGDDLLELAVYKDAGSAEELSNVFGPVFTAPIEPGWEERWKEFHQPVRLGRLWVGPPWERPDDDVVPVVIDPGRAFGTGAHPTTRMSLEFLCSLEPAGLLDVGCGSGVVAIAAAKLGFSPVVAVDLDETAVGATRTNAAMNDVVVETMCADALVHALPALDVAVANIALQAVEEVAARLRTRMLVASGYLANQRPRTSSWRAVERRESEGWAADLLERL